MTVTCVEITDSVEQTIRDSKEYNKTASEISIIMKEVMQEFLNIQPKILYSDRTRGLVSLFLKLSFVIEDFQSSSQVLPTHLKLRHDRFLSHIFQRLFTHHMFILRYISCATYKGIKYIYTQLSHPLTK